MSSQTITITRSVYLLSLVLALTNGCDNSPTYKPGKPYYFESFIGYDIPFKPTHNISRDEALQSGVYYIAIFNPQGQIVSFRKEIKGKMEFEDQYFYDAKGVLKSRKITNASGEFTTQDFDGNGKIIPSSTIKGRK